MPDPLPPEEYIEQAYFFHGLNNRLDASDPVQVVMKHLRDEVLTTTKLPLAIDYLLAELTHVGLMSTAMQKLSHYFAPFQTFVIAAAEDDQGRFDMRRALLILEYEANYRAKDASPGGMFFFQFETLCQNNLDYDYGLSAMSKDPIYDEAWSAWILSIRHKIGMVGIADLVYLYSQAYIDRQNQLTDDHISFAELDDADDAKEEAIKESLPNVTLFGEKEGRIALANRNKDPMYLFSALQRQLDYPSVPKPEKKDPIEDLLPKLIRKLERFESRVKLLEDEQRDRGIDLSQFYRKD
ncbi:MAG: hypothetical protein AAFN77_01715 [Planctomycetota bacterium]